MPGVLIGLENKADFDDADLVFSIVTVLAETLSPKQAQEALIYALARLELHIEQSDADGNWGAWLTPPTKCTDAYATFIWSSLSNPTSKIRWRAVHVVYRLVQLQCSAVIDFIVELFTRDEIGAFHSHDTPFYKHHAQLYFLIGVLRGANEEISSLLKHRLFFLSQAINSGHALVEDFASKISFKLLEGSPDIYNTAEIDRLNSGMKSQFNKITLKKGDEYVRADIATADNGLPDLHFFMDFKEYWLRPLARVFNVSPNELEQAAVSILINEWGVVPDDKYIRDPRNYQHRETHTRHSSIPATQPYDFYLGYHVIFTLASRLFKKIPIVKDDSDSEDDRWLDWLSRYLLSMDNGYFLSDIRDPSPLIRRSWIAEKVSDSWRWEIKASDFLEGLFFIDNGCTFICVTGSWSDNNGAGNEESISISSALVSSSNSGSLLNALVTCDNSDDYKLPAYNEEQFELDDTEFSLKGWLSEPDDCKRLDETDPYAGELRFPTRKVSEEYKKILGLEFCLHSRAYTDTENTLHGFSESWADSCANDRYSEQLVRQGNRLYMSLDILKKLCMKDDSSLIFEVSISRQSSTTDKDMPDDVKYPRPYCNLYILSKDGVIRDYKSRNYQLR